MNVRIGLVSDTHVPDRCAALPEVLFEVLEGVDLLLHAGDVGELWVLDELSRIAPVVAVHGNDESEDSLRVLPYQQVIAIAEQRVLLTHAHYPDRERELASRQIDDLYPKIERRVSLARDAEAEIIVFGHTHIPMLHRHEEVLLINPGALASGSALSRQRLHSVAILAVGADGDSEVKHIDLARPDGAFFPTIDLDAGYRATMSRYSESILSPELADRLTPWRDYLATQLESIANLAWNAWKRAAHPCWSGEQDLLTPDDIRREIDRSTDLPPDVRHALVRILTG